uniref:Transposase n=1 Tax=Polaromonas sp. H6N TaxID=1840293 RepID=A0A2S1FIA3_9BURK|nr:IS1182 family transposase [Polaromonas sp. H6N]AWD72233.1 transposase [Polaromonas sp. H6N]
MSASYIPYHPEQQQLLPSALQDWLPQGHLAYFINDTVDSLNLSGFHMRYAAGGPRNQPFHPAMMVKVLVYGYATGVFSSRKIARKLHEDVAFRVLAAENFPAHRTIREFRALHLSEFTELFVQVVRLAREMGLVKLGTIAVDGTKIKANASRHKAMSYARMQTTQAALKAQIAALLQKAANTDEAEKNEPDLDIPAELERRQARLAAIEAAKARLEERQRQSDAQRGRSTDDERQPKDKNGKPKGGKPYQRDFGVPASKAQDSFTDPESRIMKRAGGGFDYSYNAQTAVDETAHIIVAAEVVNTGSDVQQLPMVLAAVKIHTGSAAGQVLADAGYRSEAVMAELATTQPDTELVIALGREGKVLVKPRDAKRYPHTVAMAAKFETAKAKLDYRKRKWIAEPPNGWIKNVLGFRQFSLRGLAKAKAEFKLVCLALNLRRMGAMRAS